MKDLLIFYATDVHGSDVCFRKFLNAAKAYKPTHMILGADLSGKVIVPIYKSGSVWGAKYREADLILETDDEVKKLEERIRAAGAYPYRTSREEIDSVSGNEEAERELFRGTQLRELEKWLSLADERLAQAGVPCYAMAGNDDSPQVGELLDQSERIVNVDERVSEIDDSLFMVSLGFSTPTPWKTPREISEEDYGGRLESLFDQVPSDASVILNAHDPPVSSGLDRAPLLDDQLNVQYSADGDVAWADVGSAAVRAIVERFQPELALHGHIHESKGRYEMGRTIGFNPGSVYQESILQGVLIRMSKKKGVTDFLFTTG
jgi:Icc-related predicted phosphoesterase